MTNSTASITLLDLNTAYNALSAMMKHNRSMGIKLAWTIDDLIIKLEEENERYEKLKSQIIHKNGEKVLGHPGRYEIKDIENYSKQMHELDQILIEIEYKPINFDELVANQVDVPTDGMKVLKKYFIQKEASNGKADRGHPRKDKVSSK